ncbi:MAG: replication initiation factor domain-containing protein [Pseudomonadota bacterium]
MLENGEVKIIPARRGYGGDAAFVDWVNFTCHEETFFAFDSSRQIPIDDRQVVIEASYVLEKIFGFGVVAKRDTGANFYRDSYILGDSFGMLCHGGQRRTVLVSIYGDGLAAALPGWELRLYEFLTKKATNPKITRLDLAHDNYTGSYGVSDLSRAFDRGEFNCGGRNPSCEMRGDWKRPNGKGRSFYVGNRQNGKYFRGYEKGKQLGDSSSEWVRYEVEFKSVDRVIPFDALLKAGEYLAAAYPALSFISEKQSRIATVQKAAQIGVMTA